MTHIDIKLTFTVKQVEAIEVEMHVVILSVLDIFPTTVFFICFSNHLFNEFGLKCTMF